MLIPNFYGRFNDDGDLTDEETRQRMRWFLGALVGWAERLGKVEPSVDIR